RLFERAARHVRGERRAIGGWRADGPSVYKPGPVRLLIENQRLRGFNQRLAARHSACVASLNQRSGKLDARQLFIAESGIAAIMIPVSRIEQPSVRIGQALFRNRVAQGKSRVERS